MANTELQALLDPYRFHNQVFVLPPWEDIYVTDAEWSCPDMSGHGLFAM